jgi:hypothetical protein
MFLFILNAFAQCDFCLLTLSMFSINIINLCVLLSKILMVGGSWMLFTIIVIIHLFTCTYVVWVISPLLHFCFFSQGLILTFSWVYGIIAGVHIYAWQSQWGFCLFFCSTRVWTPRPCTLHLLAGLSHALIPFVFLFCFVCTGVWIHGVSHLLGRYSTTWATLPALFCAGYF